MDNNIIAFAAWAFMGAAFICLGTYVMNSKKIKAFGFWANAKTAPVENVRAYNRALGILWCVFGAVFIIIGLPLLAGQDSAALIITILGSMFEAIAAMAVYTTVIERKYRKK